MKSLKFHRIVSLGLVLCMLCTLLSGLSLTAFADDTQYTVTFSVPTGFVAPNPVTVVAGTTFQLETVGAPAGYTFAGWYANPIQNEVSLTDDATIYTDLYRPTASTTLYALYQRTETIPGYYEKTQGEPSSSGGKYLIVFEGADKSVAFCKQYGDGTAASHYNKKGNYFEVTVVNDQIALSSEVEAAALTIRRITTGRFSIKLPSGKYLGFKSSSSTEFQVFANEEANAIEFDALGYAVINIPSDTSGRAIRYSTDNERFQYYTSKYGVLPYLYQKIYPRTVYYSTTNPLGETPTPCTHNYAAVVTDPTCTAAGYTTYTCTLCGDTYTSDPVPASGHNYVAAVTTAATCTAAGVTTYTCSRCGDSYTEAAPAALGHSYGAFSSNNDGTHSKTCSRCGDVVTEACAYTSSTSGNTTTYTCTVCNYSYQEQSVPTVCSHNFVDNVCTLCGERFRIRSATLSLNNQIDVVYICEIPTGFTNVSLNVNGTAITDYEESGGYCYFFYTGITPQCMGDNLSATLTGSYGGQTLTATKATYSVRQYCVNRLKDSSTSDELRALVTALLVYGANAQYYMGYKTNDYVSSGNDIVNPISTAFSELSGYSASFEGISDTNTYWISVGLTLTSGVAMNYRFYAADISGLTITVTLNGEPKTYTANDFIAVDTNLYEITFEGVRPDEFNETVTAYFERDDEQVGDTLGYSVNAYIQAKQNDTNKKLRSLIRALSVYGTCVEAYLAN
ncbi:MAG: InlB B-repeat-containing protein [Oscillospiraceae bacterium]|nr:InlB B-repeat-containing protein [Oscillospiraceae bacterium]